MPMPSPAQLADAFCLMVAEWGYYFNPEKTWQMHSRPHLVYIHHTNPPVPGDVCDDNMAMLEAVGKFVDDPNPDDVDSDLWNAAFSIARSLHFLPRATVTQPNQFMCAWGYGYSCPAEVRGADTFRTSMGYSGDEIEEILELDVGEGWASESDPGGHWVWRLS